ncbi:MAG: hypothetical protein LUG93_07195, partial [Lachnospiraceae bacterium]|nr:hypothetical protein [Lachnospiraceae bacterium]
MEKIYQVYDSIFKRMFTLSNKAVINAINGLFGTSHSPDSKIDYMNRESIRKDLKYRFADIFITINDEYRYHLEAQMYHDSSIVVRVFEYGLYHALETRDDNYTLHFPEPVIIYFGNVGEIPKETSILVDFGNQGSFTYTVKNFAYQDHSIQELNNRKLILFIPFQVLRMRDILMPDGDPKDPSKKEIEELKRILESDILESIEANYKAGNITVDDYHQLCELTNKLYIQVLLNYEEKGGDTTVKELLPGAIELPNDVYRIRIDELEEQNGILT